MKTKLILGGFLALSGIAGAQNTFPSSGNAGIGTTLPSDKLEVIAAADAGITITEPSAAGYGARLSLKNLTTGGRNWGLFSCGLNNAQGSGNFLIYDYSSGQNRLLIEGSTGNMGVGLINPSARIHGAGASVGMRGDASPATGGSGTGVAGNGIGNGSSLGAVGVPGRAYDATTNTAGYFAARAGAAGVTSYGLYSEIFFPTLGGTNYGIYTSVGGNSNSGTGPNYAAYFNGDVVTTSTTFYPSDRRIKKDIARIDNSLNIIKQLNPVTYNFDTEGNKTVVLPGEKQYGFISQEIQEILPEFTKTIVNPAKQDEKGNEISPKKEILGLNYNGFIALLTKGMQEQQETIEAQQKQLDAQKNLIDQLMQKSAAATGISSINSAGGDYSMLQNEPNPFSRETVIRYTLPQHVSSASLLVYDLTGRQLATFPVTEKGSASITITSEKLAAGIYIYSIVTDGKIVDSKRMIIAEK